MTDTRDTDRPAGDDVLAAEDLVLRYPESDTPVIDGATHAFPEGRVTALVGPNGSGKSTLLRGLAGRLAPRSGTVTLRGRPLDDYGDRERARELARLPQEPTAPDGITVEELAYHGRYPHRGFLDTVDDADVTAVDRALRLVGIDRLRDRPLADLSGGQRRLAWVAMVLAQDADVLLLDEPTTFLDLRHQLAVMDVVRTLREDDETTVVLVLHDIEQAARYADEMVVLRQGDVHAAGPPASVLEPDLLAEVFGIEAEVEPGRFGPRITPIGPADSVTGSR
ncbi:ABC transporter ATP-binding protein [Halobaculum magnesiiphilum]|uniref:Cobalamin import ATP-binding protein BtuD n=1 Tax=Halobaculum magnesiiphilum TaxID=1017351 RepID=A0A8T8WAN4_9EURY|nr:ABC transporter ATP-binding protein [Halobaculum magnesiiphilum]QZP36896.1 ABC transporter ATP-binding protein [Halobaculum magnesiiphilum]